MQYDIIIVIIQVPQKSYQIQNPMIAYIVAAYWIFISFIALKINLTTFQKMSKYSKFKDQNSQWQGLVRKDFGTWNKRNILLGSFTILPLRFFALANFLAGAFIFSLFITILRQGNFKTKAIKCLFWYFNNYGKLMCNVAMKIQDNCPKPQDSKIKTPIIISNHSCWFDTFYITLKYSPVSYVAKYEVQFWPIIGACAKAMNCIFVKRQNENDRNVVKDLIKQRIEDFNKKKEDANPLVIYPEGTSSNNRVILTFKSGAFQNLSPITIFCIKYQCDGCLLGQDELQQSQQIFIMLSQQNKMKITKIQVQPKQAQTCEQYKQRCRDILSQNLGFKKVNLGYRNRLDLQKFRKAGVKISD